MLVSASCFSILPAWLHVLLIDKFFNACINHEAERKNEKNILCLDCCFSICPHCLSHHGSHRLLQIRRYVYHDVIRLDDAEKLLDCSFVQSYTTNSAKVIFINPRPQARQFRCSGNVCSSCDRSLQDPYFFCSIFCKAVHVMRTEGNEGLSGLVLDCKLLTLSDPGSDDCLMTPESVLETTGSSHTSSDSTGEDGCSNDVACTADTEVVRKKRTSLSSTCRPILSRITEMSSAFMNRRKKTPSRAPLY